MKSNLCLTIFLTFFSLARTFAGNIDPRTNSWFTTYSGQYARIFTNNNKKATNAALTTWSNGSQTQSAPSYCGVQEDDSSSIWVYVFSTGLSGYNMCPRHNGAFPNLPTNQKLLFR